MATQFEIDCALMAGDAYYSNRDPINRFPIPQGWTERTEYRTRNDSSGFEAATFQNSTNIVISFAGTNPLEIGDWTQGNVPLAFGKVSGQLKDAVDYYLQVRRENMDATITFTGHSLGGGIAALMGIFFGKQAVTFDQAPFANTASSASDLKTYLLGKTYTDPAMTAVRDAAVADLGSYIQQQQTNGGIPNSNLVSTFRVTGEFTSSGVVGTLFRPIGSDPTWFELGPTDISSFTEKHDMTLLAAFLQSQQAVANTPDSDKTLSKVTFKLTDLLGMIFDKSLFANSTSSDKPNLLEHLVQQQSPTNEVTRFTSDLWQIAQDGGLTLTDKNLADALSAFAMQMYYEDTDNAKDKTKQLYTSVTGGIQFDMADVSKTFATAVTKNETFNLDDAKGYKQYFRLFLDQYYTKMIPDGVGGTTPETSPDKALILSLLPYLRDWAIQAGASPLIFADDKNRNAFLLGGSGADALIGGTGTDLLVGNGGADTLMGKEGNDFLLGGAGADNYVYRTGDGLDTIQDADGGKIYMDDVQLIGGAQYGDTNVHRSADGKHLYVAAGSNLIIDGDIISANDHNYIFERNAA